MRTLLLGFDAFDPALFEQLVEQGQLPNLTAAVQSRSYARLTVTNPPQSEVSWTSIATGLSPGGHGLFDFVHRDPATYRPYVSLLPTLTGRLGTTFVAPYQALTIFERAAERGFPATALWWPALFPARRDSLAQAVPGLGTPDIHGRLGVGTLFTTQADLAGTLRRTPVAVLTRQGGRRYVGTVTGPARQSRANPEPALQQLALEVTGDASARLWLGAGLIDLQLGIWSPIFELSFKVGPLLTLRAITRVILTQVRPEIRCYMLPLQIHPLHPIWPYTTPQSFARRLWREDGPFLTLGWPQDTTALEEGCIDDTQFLALCDDIFHTQAAIFLRQAARLHEGILAGVFDTLDRVQHMFWRSRPDIVQTWYGRLDRLVGEVGAVIAAQDHPPPQVMVVSDHGFCDFHTKAHLNRWLIDEGYLVAPPDRESGDLRQTDWRRSRAYALGLNSIYLNLAGREAQGCVDIAQAEALRRDMRERLLRWRDPDGQPVVAQVWTQAEAFDGPLAERGPDLVIGYAAGYRASAQTGLGEWVGHSLEPNRGHWEADHCVAAPLVPGVLFASQGLREHPHPSYRDIAALALGSRDTWGEPPPTAPDEPDSDEDQQLVEQRLKDLGYL